MERLAFEVSRPRVAMRGGGLFPVRRIYCIGRNYAAHAREMGGDPVREAPFFFQKPGDAILGVPDGTVADYPYPPLTADLHHEVELVVFLSGGGRDLALHEAASCILGYAVGIDMTRRDRQQESKDRRHPWEVGKSFDRSAPVGEIVPATAFSGTGRIRLAVDGAVRQDADLAEMVWSVPEQIAALSRADELHPGDVVMTGTPAGVGPLVRGDEVHACIDGLPALRLRVR